MTGNVRKIVKFVVFVAFVGAVAYVLLFTPFGARLLSPAGRKELVDRIDGVVRAAGIFGPVVFVLIYTLGVLALPATPFSAAGSFIFGKYAGAAVNVAGVAAGASLAFFLGRYFLRDLAKSLLVGRLGDLDRKAGEHGFPVVFYLRVVWFPFIVLNYAAGATSIRFRDYFWGTVLGTLPSVLILSFFFGSLKEIVAAYRVPSDLLRIDVLAPAVLLVLSLFLPAAVKRLRRGTPAFGPPPDAG
ncbi:MAG: TVP38/TMEM64 family protein [Gemmatimonadota bacterium]